MVTITVLNCRGRNTPSRYCPEPASTCTETNIRETMAASTDSAELKRKLDDNEGEGGDGEEEEWVGPMPEEATQSKKRKGMFFRHRRF